MSQHLRGFASLLTDISQHLEQLDGQDGGGLRKARGSHGSHGSLAEVYEYPGT